MVGLVLALAGCGPKYTADGVDSELAALRQEQQAMREEIAALRTEIVRLTEALADRGPVDTDAGVQPQEAAVAPVPVELADFPPYVTLAAPAETQIAALLDEYRRALEGEDLGQMRDLVYHGELPADDREFLELLFGRTEQLRVETEPLAIDVQNDHASAVVRQTMRFRLKPSYESKKLRLDMRMQLERQGGGWRVTRVELLR